MNAFLRSIALLTTAFVIVGIVISSALSSGFLWQYLESRLNQYESLRLISILTNNSDKKGMLNIIYGSPKFIQSVIKNQGKTKLEYIPLTVHEVSAANIEVLMTVLSKKPKWTLTVETTPIIFSNYHSAAPLFKLLHLAESRGNVWQIKYWIQNARHFFDIIAAWAHAPADEGSDGSSPSSNLDQLLFFATPPSAPKLAEQIDRLRFQLNFIGSEEGFDETSNPVLFTAMRNHLKQLPKQIDSSYIQKTDKNWIDVTKKLEIGSSLAFTPPHNFQPGLNGYPENFSTLKGGDIILRFAGDVTFEGDQITDIQIKSLTGDQLYRIPVSPHKFVPVQPCNSFANNGCEFEGLLTVSTTDLMPDFYRAVLKTKLGKSSNPIFFLIKHQVDDPERGSVAFVLPFFTWQAYNPSGGGTLHSGPVEKNSTRTMREVSFLRPYRHTIANFYPKLSTEPIPTPNSPQAAAVIPRFLAQSGRKATFISDVDLHNDFEALGGIKTLILLVHDEYWTLEKRRNFEKFLTSGGRALILGGNTCWWKARLVGSRLLVDKSNKDNAPIYADRTGKWHESHINEPCETTFGSNYYLGGKPIKRKWPLFGDIPSKKRTNAKITFNAYSQSGGFQIIDPSHPIFTGLQVKKHELIGQTVPISYIEIDGVPLNAAGDIDYEVAKSVPIGIHPIMHTLTYSTSGKIYDAASVLEFHYRGKGHVLNMGTHGWMLGTLKKNPEIEKIILNAFDYINRK